MDEEKGLEKHGSICYVSYVTKPLSQTVAHIVIGFGNGRGK